MLFPSDLEFPEFPSDLGFKVAGPGISEPVRRWVVVVVLTVYRRFTNVEVGEGGVFVGSGAVAEGGRARAGC